MTEQLALTNPAAPVEIEGAGQVSGLIALAINKNVPVEVLERLVALQERVSEKQARQAFFEAVAAFQEEAPEIEKNKTAKIATRSGGSYAYTYAPLESITRAIRPLLKKHGLGFSWTTEPSDRPDTLMVVCILRHVEGHEERATFPVPTTTDAAMSAAQKNGAALTYGRRQSLVAVLGLVTADEDDDAPERPAGPISDEQFKILSELADEVKADKAGFCKYLGVGSIREIPANRFNEAKAALEQKKPRK